jgi:acetaldehyde dehydrogenase (acetylating)
VDRSADLKKAAKYIVASKAFDHSVICATEQAVVADRPIAAELAELMKAEGAYFVDEAQAKALAGVLFSGAHVINPKSVGKNPQQLAEMAGISVPNWARILVARLSKVGDEEPLSGEKLTTVLGWYEVDGWEAGCDRCIDLIHFGGRGHSLVIHAQDDNVVMKFGLEKPVFRIMVNTWGTLGATGYTTGITPSMTLGSGGIGGAITGDNISVHHMYNIKRLTYELREAPPEAYTEGPVNGSTTTVGAPASNGTTDAEIEEIVRKVLSELRG